MKKLIQVLIACGLFVVMGGTASGFDNTSIFVKGDEGILYLLNHTGCPLCHTIPGIDGAVGELGPKLTKKSIERSFNNPEYKGKAKNLREYVVESILKPSAYLVYNIEADEPWVDDLMPPTYREQMTDNALNKIVEYLLNPKVISDEEYKIYAKQKQIFDKEEMDREGKVVVSVVLAHDYFEEFERLDDFEEFSHYDNWVGCSYKMQVSNNTKTKIKLDALNLGSNNPLLESMVGSVSMRFPAFFVFKALIKPGQIYAPSNIKRISKNIAKTKVKATEEQKKKWILKYGCKAQKGSLYIIADPKYIKFPKDSGVSENEKIKYLIGNNSGPNPLEKKIKIKD